MINVTVDDTQIKQALHNLLAVTSDLSPALKAIGELLVESTQQRFSSGTGPDGQPWQANSAVTIKRKGRNTPLVDSGTLMQQIHAHVIGNSLEVSSSMEYAAMQQFGGTKAEFPSLWSDIPARPFMGISNSDEDAILAEIRRHVENAF